MLPAISINSFKIGDWGRGKIFNMLKKKFSSNTNVDIEIQIKTWNSDQLKGSNSNVPTPYSFK